MTRNLMMRSRLLITFLFLLFSIPISLIGQLSNPVFTPRGSIGKESGIVLLVQNLQNPCGNTVGLGKKKTFFRLRLSGVKNRYSSGKSKFKLILRLKVEDCSGRVINKNHSIDLNKYNKDGEVRNESQWYFEGSKLLSFDGIIQETEIKPACESVLPDEIILSKDYDIDPGETISISIDDAGFLCQNAQWQWMEGECEDVNQIQMGKNRSINVSPLTTTNYYVRFKEPNNVSSCISATVYVKEGAAIEEEKPVATRRAVFVSGVPENEICPKTKLRLSVSGGLNNNNNKWVWRKNSCNGEVVGMGSNFDYSADDRGFLYVQDVNDADGECKEVKIIVKQAELNFDLSINSGQSIVSICEGESVKLVLTSSSEASKFRLKWFDEQNNLLFENSSSITISPTNSTRYFVQAEGECNKIKKSSSIEVQIINKSTKPQSVTESRESGRTYKFSINGGSLENGASWKWYNGNNCISESVIGEGSEITAKITKLTGLSVRAEGGTCGVSECYNHALINKPKKRKFIFINAGLIDHGLLDQGVLDKGLNNMSFTVGSKRIYFRYKTAIKNIDAPYNVSYSNVAGYTILNYPTQTNTYYQFNGKTATIRNSYTGGFMIGGRGIRIYLGGGIGKVTTLRGFNIINSSDPANKTEKWGILQSQNYKGIEGEAGIFLRLGFLNIMGGLNLIYDKNNGQYIDGTAGIGLTF